MDTLAKNKMPKRGVPAGEVIDITDLNGIRDQVTVDGTTSFLFGGDINQLLRKLSDGNILDIHISEPDLEEIFCIIMKRTVIGHDDCKARIKARQKIPF